MQILGDRVLVKPLPKKPGIIDFLRQDIGDERVCDCAEVIAVSDTPEFKLGDVIVFSPFHSIEVKKGEFLVDFSDVLMVGSMEEIKQFFDEDENAS